MRQTQALIDIHREALAEFSDIWEVMDPIRRECFEDRRFCDERGAQWDGALGEQFKNKPRFEVNKVHLAVQRLVNDYRNNPVDADFVSKDGANADKLADACDMLMRADEQDSGAEDVKTNAVQEAIKGGFGAWRLCADYEDEDDPDDERQRIEFEQINDADLTVFFDLDAKRQDKADARRCFVLVPYTVPRFKDEWGVNPVEWPETITSQWGNFKWVQPDVVYVAEYYRKTERKYWEVTFTGLVGETEVYSEDDLDDETLSDIEARGLRQTDRKRKKTKVVRKYIMSGGGVLEDCGEIPGGEIPIIPVYGKQVFLNGIEHCSGHVRNAKDPQRLANMQRSKLAEISAFSSVEKPMFSWEQIAQHQHIWNDDDVEDYKFLPVEPLYNPDGTIAHVGPLGYTKPPMVPPALAALMQVTEQDLNDVLGNQQNGEQIVSNVAAKAVELVQDKIDMQSYIYVSNAAKAEKRSAEVWLAMARVLYTKKGRKMRGMDKAGQPQVLELKKPGLAEDGSMVLENDLENAKFQVVAVPGPSSSTKRKGMVQTLSNVIAVTQDPQTRTVLESLILMNMEGEGMTDVNDWARGRLVQIGAIKPTEEERQQMAQAAQNAEPDANTKFLEASAQEAAAKALKAQADTDLTKAKTLETLAKVDESKQQQALNVLDRITPEAPNVDVVAVNPNIPQ